MNALRAAERYVGRGFAVVPIPHRRKGPNLEGWEGLCLTIEELPEHFNCRPQNVGLVLGEPSGWLAEDVDLDTEEAAKIAGHFLPPTVTSGRESRPHSHWWYGSPGAETTRYKGVDGEVLVELRSTGCQIIVEPSVHPSGEWVVWHRGGLELAEVGAEELSRRVRELATAALIARRVPPEGGKHDFAMPVAGFLLRSGRLDEETVIRILLAAWHAAGADTREAVRDLKGIVRDTTENLERGEPVVGGPTLEEHAPGIVRLLRKWWGWERREATEEKEDKPTQAQLLVRCAAGAELFHTPAGDAYAFMPVGDHGETHQIKSKGFRRWLVRTYFAEQDRPPGAQALQDALGLLEARAQFDGTEREVHVRVAEHGGAIYVDLANERWEVVEITAGGWRVMPGERAPVRFRRPRGMLALPTPTSFARDGGDDLGGLLRRFINVSDEGSIRLVIAWLVQAFRPTGPYPVLIFQGEQGSAKSTAERLVRTLVNPSTAPLRTTPRNERDLVIAATNSWCVAFDNISTLQPWFSDASCRLSTGGGFSARELYTDAEEVLFDATRPQLFNGITEVATRPDLLDRALVVTLPPIPEERRRPEAELWREFEEARPRIRAALFDAVSGALGAVEDVRLEGNPRMADFAVCPRRPRAL